LIGEECGTLKEAIKKSVLEFLHENPDKAYSFVEINSNFSAPGRDSLCRHCYFCARRTGRREKSNL